ncbi:MAG: hydroxymethylglutaryl-CoA reductase, degradative [Saprospiraceae bacterium]|nr:hydroxymethylglutaryl-CoA reductase, degradative [Saprospiraceae bacterium]
MNKIISGFSKLSKTQKIKWLGENYTDNPDAFEAELSSWRHSDDATQRVVDGFTENAIANYVLPYSVAPNFIINGRTYAVPMVIEESSVVAAASSAAKFWQERGGFHAEVVSTLKIGQVHFMWSGKPERLYEIFKILKPRLFEATKDLTANMRERGGGITSIQLLDFENLEPGLYQIRAWFETCDSMGANFINSVLERFADTLESFFTEYPDLADDERDVEVIMSILSNYTPECLVKAWVECPIAAFADLARSQGMDADSLARRFQMAVRIAQIDPFRATTHNKGIFNGIDAVVMATGNDFRAIEAGGHTYAARNSQYRSLSTCTVKNGHFRFELELPLAVGTVGGLTALHPLAKRSLEILGKPSARELMCIIAAVGLAQNFAAVRSLITTGIQQGHMKMHLTNILNHLGASEEESAAAQFHFQHQTVSFSAVRAFLQEKRS